MPAARRWSRAQEQRHQDRHVAGPGYVLKDKIGDDGLVENKAVLLPDAPSNNWKPD